MNPLFRLRLFVHAGILLVASWVGQPAVIAGEALAIKRHGLPIPPDLNRADLYVAKTAWAPVAVLILCPGCNESGESLVRKSDWQDFARQHSLALVGLSFASDIELLRADRGYYYASQGSGEALIQAIRMLYGKDLPLLLYGFSGGAHFTSRFVEWRPQGIVSWCAYSAAWWASPKRQRVAPPGIVACGDADPQRYGPSLIYFKEGRALGKPWTWVSLPGVGHVSSPRLDRFVREYFAAVLGRSTSDLPGESTGVWRDVDTQERLTPAEASQRPTVSSFCPDFSLAKRWGELHMP